MYSQMYKWTGGEMEADLCIVATGAKGTPPLYKDSGLEDWLDERGMLKVISLSTLYLFQPIFADSQRTCLIQA